MKLPQAEVAVVAPAKVHSYLLSPDHPVGGDKAAFFAGLGYAPAAWRVLLEDLERQAREGTVVRISESPFGRKYRVRDNLIGPNGRSAILITVWIRAHADAAPRFLTAFPRSKP
ncbi:MAG: hypothetical protein IPN34_13940 [Planctomycetes bacterium]|nr:hypothetical protein [Planctomycetota bacterium]